MKSDEDHGEKDKVAMNVLHDKGKRVFSTVSVSRFSYGARRRVSPECLVIRAPEIIAGEAYAYGDPNNEKRRRIMEPSRIPGRFGTKEAMRRAAKELRAIKRRQIRAAEIMRTLPNRPKRIADEKRKA
jgi:hypothetical protein